MTDHYVNNFNDFKIGEIYAVSSSRVLLEERPAGYLTYTYVFINDIVHRPLLCLDNNTQLNCSAQWGTQERAAVFLYDKKVYYILARMFETCEDRVYVFSFEPT